MALDLRTRASATGWIARIEARTGQPVDILANNAGGVAGQTPSPVEDVSDQDWNTFFDINVNAALALCQEAAPGMKLAGGGRTVNISSGAGSQPSLTGIQAYCSARVGLMRQMAYELGRFNITVDAVAPGSSGPMRRLKRNGKVMALPDRLRRWSGVP